jgi:hypothetical protein
MEIGKKGLMAIIASFIIVLIGIILLMNTSNDVTSLSTTPTVINETVAAFNSHATQTLANDDLVSLTSLVNASDATIPATNYTVNLAAGTFIINAETSHTNGTAVKATYVYYASTYVKDRTAVSLANLVILFFALGIVVIMAGYAIMMLKDSGAM